MIDDLLVCDILRTPTDFTSWYLEIVRKEFSCADATLAELYLQRVTSTRNRDGASLNCGKIIGYFSAVHGYLLAAFESRDTNSLTIDDVTLLLGLTTANVMLRDYFAEASVVISK